MPTIKILRVAAFLLLLGTVPSTYAVDIIMDDLDPGTTTSGPAWSTGWQIANLPSAHQGRTIRSSTATAWAQFALGAISSGPHEVYMWWPQSAVPQEVDATATITITHASGVQEVVVNQQQNGGQWNLLGKWSLDTSSKIRLTSKGIRVFFDAVKLVPVVPQPPTLELSASEVRTSLMAWTSSNASSCIASGAWSGEKGATGSELVTNSGTATYDLECVGDGGGIERTVKVTAGTPAPPDIMQCANGVDDADPEDILVDLADPGCNNAADDDETDSVALVECNDGIDNADVEDVLVDMSDPGCSSPLDTSEDNAALVQCNDGVDNADAEDTLADFPADPGCANAADTDETDEAIPLVECNDLVDNADAEDTLIDMSDPGCSSPLDTSEANAAVECNDGVDNADTEDTLIDLADPGCSSATDTSEINAVVQCNDGIDNTDPEDTLIDMADPGCSTPTDTSETNSVANKPLIGLGVGAATGTFDAAGKQFTAELNPDSLRCGYKVPTAAYLDCINWAQTHGKRALLFLGYGEGCDVRTAAGRQCYANRSAGLVQTHGSSASSTVQYYEVWNEWNGGKGLGVGWQTPPANDPVMYTDLLCKTYTAIKAVAFNAKVVGGALAGANQEFLTGMLNAGAWNCMDLLSIHLYVYRQGWPGHVDANDPASVGVDKFIERVNATNALMIAKGGGSKPILVTEAGFHGDDTPAAQQLAAEYVTELYTRVPTVSVLQGTWWFELEDSPGILGLVYSNNVKKPRFAAYKALVK